MKNKFSYIKERIKEIADNKGIPIGKFFKELGVSPTGFSGEKLKIGVNSDTIEKIIYIYPDVDLYWLITGKAKNEDLKVKNEVNEPSADYAKETIESLKQTISAKDETIQSLKEQIKLMSDGQSKAS